MRRRVILLQISTLAAVVTLASGSPTAAQTGPDSGPDVVIDSSTFGGTPADNSGFGALVGVMIVVGLGFAIFKFVTVRDMGIRRGLSERDATAAALFSDDEVTSTMILKPEVTRPVRRSPDPASDERTASIEERLAKIEGLRERGVISDVEAASRRDEILDEI